MKKYFSLLIIVPILVLSCAPKLFEPHEVETQQEAGSVNIAVLSVGTWEEYKKKLQPKFNLTADQALGKVVPTTSVFEEKFLYAIQASLKLAPPTSFKTRTDTTTVSSGLTTTDQAKTFEKGAGDPSAINFEKNIAADRDINKIGPKKSILDTKNLTGIDPMLQYLAATALYQEVQMLNNYLNNLSDRESYEPYVVRLQVSLMPNARNEPYDVYSNISFFNRISHKNIKFNKINDTNKYTKKTNKQTGEVDEELDCTTEEQDGFVNYLFCKQPHLLTKDSVNYGKSRFAEDNPEIVPLLVTDNVEAMLRSRSVDSISQFAASLMFMTKGFGGMFDIQRREEKLQSILGKELNSLLTVSKTSGNSIRVRLGAAHQVQSKYAIVPRTHNITLVVLVPKPHTTEKVKLEDLKREVEIISESTFVHVETGEELKDVRDFKTTVQYKNNITKVRNTYANLITEPESPALEKLPGVINN